MNGDDQKEQQLVEQINTNNNNNNQQNHNNLVHDDDESQQHLQSSPLHIPPRITTTFISSAPSHIIHPPRQQITNNKVNSSTMTDLSYEIDISIIDEFEDIPKNKNINEPSSEEELVLFRMSTINIENKHSQYVNTCQQTHKTSTISSSIPNDLPPHIMFKNLLNRLKRFENHLKILNIHIQQHTFPSSLSSMPQPTIGADNDDFIKEWKEIINDSRHRFLIKTIEHVENIINQTNIKIQSIFSLIQPNKRLEIESQVDQQLKLFMKKAWCKLIRQVKPKIKITENNFGFKNFKNNNNSTPSSANRSSSPSHQQQQQQQQRIQKNNKNKTTRQNQHQEGHKQVHFNLNNSSSSSSLTAQPSTTTSHTTSTTSNPQQQQQHKQTTNGYINTNKNNDNYNYNNNRMYRQNQQRRFPNSSSYGYYNNNYYSYNNSTPYYSQYYNRSNWNNNSYNRRNRYYNNNKKNYSNYYNNNYQRHFNDSNNNNCINSNYGQQNMNSKNLYPQYPDPVFYPQQQHHQEIQQPIPPLLNPPKNQRQDQMWIPSYQQQLPQQSHPLQLQQLTPQQQQMFTTTPLPLLY